MVQVSVNGMVLNFSDSSRSVASSEPDDAAHAAGCCKSVFRACRPQQICMPNCNEPKEVAMSIAFIVLVVACSIALVRLCRRKKNDDSVNSTLSSNLSLSSLEKASDDSDDDSVESDDSVERAFAQALAKHNRRQALENGGNASSDVNGAVNGAVGESQRETEEDVV